MTPENDRSPKSKLRILSLGASYQLGNLRGWILELAGFDVVTSTGMRWGRVLETDRFDCLLLGHSANEEACKRFARNFKGKNPGSPIIAVVQNAWTRYGFPVDLYVCGMDGPTALLEAVRRCCENRRNR